MTTPAIQIQNLSKRFRLGAVCSANRTLREALADSTSNLLRRATGKNARAPREDLWALKDIDLNVQPGEVLGLIGHNGAGKSTLLKVLSRITWPTHGSVKLNGRVGSLLEVGTGFHPELTGRENIFLNGAVLGMKRPEIRAKFDQIVQFAELAKFLDTPVKRYSSGMYTRLAFAVAAHLEPEIMLVDEVLAVGDADFQKRCLGKMKDVASSGRTIVFVSHRMSAIRSLCSRAVLLHDGKLAADGPADAVINQYLAGAATDNTNAAVDLTQWAGRYGSGELRINAARMLDQKNNPTTTFCRNQSITIEFDIAVETPQHVNLSAICSTSDGTPVLHVAHLDTGTDKPCQLNHTTRASFTIPALPLAAGNYTWTLGLHSAAHTPIDVTPDALNFTAADDPKSTRPYPTIASNGLCIPQTKWNIQPLQHHAAA